MTIVQVPENAAYWDLANERRAHYSYELSQSHAPRQSHEIHPLMVRLRPAFAVTTQVGVRKELVINPADPKNRLRDQCAHIYLRCR